MPKARRPDDTVATAAERQTEGNPMMLRFAFAIVLAMHAWSSVLLAACPDRQQYLEAIHKSKPINLCWPVPGPNQIVIPDSDGWPTLVDDPDHVLTSLSRPMPFPEIHDDPVATKGDIDALNKRLDQLEDLIRCEAASARTRAGGYSGAMVPCR
jgi:hypothetical protein